MRTFKVATRGSDLARAQADYVRKALIAQGYAAELSIVATAGDKSMAPVERIGVGVFTTAIREAIFQREADVAVHSFKDLPTAAEPRAHLVVPVRADRSEALIARDGMALADLPVGARVGTSAPRRISQLKAMRPDLDIRPLRGNINSRMGRVDSGELDAVVLAYAGLTRVGLGHKATQVFNAEEFMPAPAQGALAVECRADDDEARQALDKLVNPGEAACAFAERAVLAALEAGCTAPVAASATINDGEIALRAGVFALDGGGCIIEEGKGTDPQELGQKVAAAMFDAGAATFL